ncbi:MAG: MCE family protein [Pelatocladus maniniholoensis HA4357-MV3]|jgi:phospholipid/cholesterol/gamma-HCH transport system substrate-binding protein|uniref:MCE family protein n=1 Tax=Pelatocladus maniniholoensis HA4357-MV3 TaxID=1117104 RepID=A0A9E3LVG4_9NOST|nr:MCE family protein [Pelatocladus maniniholoensis HA4357-MV3]
MRSRTFREGSVGLLLLVGVGVFGIIILWLTRFTAAASSYKAFVEFANAGGMQKGAVVRFRGVKVGNISSIRPRPNNVEVEIEIANPNLIIPRDVKVEANQSGLINESIIDITPKSPLPSGTIAKPLDKDCDPSLIVCNGSRLKGQIGISLDELIRSSTVFANLYTQPQIYDNLNNTLVNASKAAGQVVVLSRDLSNLTKSTQKQLSGLSTATNSVANAADKITASATKTTSQFSDTASAFSTTAKDLSLTANQASQLIKNLDTLLTSNRSSLVGTLNNITATTTELRTTVSSLSPTLNRLTQGELVQNLETLSANAAQASANLRDASQALNNPNNILVLQQTLDSARVTFENVEKITSDLDELTGDPAFRENVKQLVNGLGKLLSSTQQIEQQIEVASTLDAVKTAVKNPKATTLTTNKNQHKNKNQPNIEFNLSPTTLMSASKEIQPTAIEFSTSESQEKLLHKLREYSKNRGSGIGDRGQGGERGEGRYGEHEGQ